MPYKITKVSRAKIYKPTNSGPMFATNIITCNKTKSNGNVENISEMNAVCAREWVDENHK